MKKRIMCGLLSMLLLIGMTVPGAAVSAGDSEYGWPEMQGDIAMRVMSNGAEVTRLVVGETYQLQFWLQNIAPYTITLPLAWDPNVVAVVDGTSSAPVSSGRKNDGEPTGFRAGSKCYESDYDWFTYEPLYWNGRPVYSADENNGAYPYLDQASGLYRLCYYVSAPNAPLEAQMFLEVNFRVLAKGDPNFHIATSADGPGRYDPAEPNGLSVVVPGGDKGAQYVSYGTDIFCPDLQVMTQAEYDEAASKPNSSIQPGGGNGSTGQQKPEKEPPKIMVSLVPAEHLNCFPYSTAMQTAAVLKHINNEVTQDSDCILPGNLITDAVNRAGSGNRRSLLVNMPEKIIPKDEYALVFNLENIDDMADAKLSMLYIETPWAYVGLNTAILANQTDDSAQARLCVRPVGMGGDGLQVTMTLDGETVAGFSGSAVRVILPYHVQDDGTLVLPTTDDAFGPGEASGLPLSLYKADADHGVLIFLSPSFGYYNVTRSEAVTFSDLGSVPWAKEPIEALAQRKILRGVGDGRFDPNGPVTREQFATMLVTAFGMYCATGENSFDDVTDGAWYEPYVTSAASAGLVSGLEDGRFGTGRTISRQDLAVMAYRALTQLGVTLPRTREPVTFADDGSIAGYAREAVYALYGAEVISGAGEGVFAPNAPASRAQAARILHGVLALTDGIL